MEVTWQIVFYRTASGNCPAEEFFKGFDKKQQAYLEHKLDQLAVFGNTHTDIRPLKRGLFEFKVKTGHIQIRMPFFFAPGFTIVITHGFQKREKTKTQQLELERARKYKQDYESREKG